MKTSTMPIYSMKLAGYLMQKGFVLLSMKPNYKFPERNVFYFTDAEETKKAIDEYKQKEDNKTNVKANESERFNWRE